MSKENSERAVLITTAHRGVFFGRVTDTANLPKSIKVSGARNCLYWPTNNKGFIGLAAHGPLAGSRVGPAADIELFDITAVVECSAEAIKAWDDAPWSR